MKKIIASAVGLMLAGGIATTASAAVENEFGGYWRTRFTYQDNILTGTNTPSVFYVDTRTRLFYTAKFSDDFKFVNKFEFNTGWGDANGGSGTGAGGDIGADGKGNWRIKNSYADFNIGPVVNAKVGIQGFTLARGFLFDDDASGVMVTGKFGNVTVPLVWINAANKDVVTTDGMLPNANNVNVFAALAAIKINDAITVTPYFVDQVMDFAATGKDGNYWWLGADADMKFGSVTTWATAIYNGGTVNNVDTSAYLGAVGADAGLVHGQAFYSSGQKFGDDPTKNNQFVGIPGLQPKYASANTGSSYYWAEIMGYGIFDNPVAHGTLADDITNIWAANVGVTFKPMDKLKLTGDVWYASLAQSWDKTGDKELGWELDGVASYSIYDNLTADLVIAYLFSGDAVGPENITEGGVRLSLKF